MTTQFERFRDTMKRVLMLDQADLDFGIYRIMNQKRDDIERYLDRDLRRQVAEVIKMNANHDSEADRQELNKLVETLTAAGINPDESPKVKELRAKIAAAGSSDDLENEVYSHLTTFFSRYYDGGDFVSQRRYKKDVYAIPYEGEEVKLHWANADQYYIKTGEYFRNYRFALADGRHCEFTLREATTEQNNNVSQNNMERRFALLGEQPVETVGDTLHINFTYQLYPKATKQRALIEEAYQKLVPLLPDDYKAAVLALRPTEKDKSRTLLQKHLADYVARNQFDYFIHKDLQGFLSRELDFYIKNEMLFIDDIDDRTAESFRRPFTVIRAVKAVGRKLIAFLAQLENYQKRLWLKKKFVVEADYCITLDRIPRSLYADICRSEEQRKEWVRLFAIDEIKGDVLTSAYSEPLTEKFLEENPHLVLDTKFFTADFKHRLLSSVNNLDEQCDGLLINSENFQALNLLQEKYREQVKCIYIDPPYNTGGDGFTYKDCYQHSSWLTMMENRLRKAWNTLPSDGVIFISIDDNEDANLKELCDSVFGEKNFVTQILWKGRGGRQDSKHYAVIHEYILCYAKSLDGFVAGEEIVKVGDYPKYDEKAKRRYKLQLLRKWGSNSRREDRPNLYYSIKGPNGEDIYPTIYDNALKSKILGRWRWSANTMAKAIQEGRIEFIKNSWGEYVPYEKIYEPNEDEVPSKKYTTWIDNIGNGTSNLKELFRDSVFDYPKSAELVQLFVRMQGLCGDEVILDFFAGSGTTAHAVINLNREDGDAGKRKYILCEMGDYFDTVTKPRIEKVVYSRDWKDGKPVSRQGSSHCFKYMRLEQYEDTLNNLTVQPVAIDKDNAQFYGGYIMGYLLDTETRDSLFSLRWFRNPWAVKLRVTRQNETREEAVDLVETFNYLIGLRVEAMLFPADGICTVEGTTRRGDRTLVIWRDCDKVSNAALDDFFRRQAYSTRDTEFDRIYVNGDNNLENLRRDEETWKVVLTEQEFQKRMFEED